MLETEISSPEWAKQTGGATSLTTEPNTASFDVAPCGAFDSIRSTILRLTPQATRCRRSAAKARHRSSGSCNIIYSREAATSHSLGRKSQVSKHHPSKAPAGATSMNVITRPTRPQPSPHAPRVFPQPRPSDKMPSTHPNEGSEPDFATTCRLENRWRTSTHVR